MDNDLLLYILIFAIPLCADLYVKINYKKYKDISNSYKLTGFDVAKKILAANGLGNLYIVQTNGTLTDNYDPSRKVVRLSPEVYDGDSIASLAIAAHECGHALQDKDNYVFLRIRCAIFPIISFANKLAYIVLILGLVLEIMDLVWLGIICVSAGLLFQLITLPVEVNASKRAMIQIKKLNLTNDNGINGTSKMLISAALTYLAGVLSSALEVLRLVLMFTNRRD